MNEDEIYELKAHNSLNRLQKLLVFDRNRNRLLHPRFMVEKNSKRLEDGLLFRLLPINACRQGVYAGKNQNLQRVKLIAGIIIVVL